MIRRRLVLGTLLPALLVTGTVTAPSATAADGDRVVIERIEPGIGGALTRTVSDGPGMGGYLFSTGVLSLGNWQIDLADSMQPAPGTYVLGTSSTRHRVLGLCSSAREGRLQIDDFAAEGSTVTRLVASVAVRCSPANGISTWVSASVRIGTTAPFSVVRPAPVTAPTVGQGTASPVTTTLKNTGDASTAVLGAAALDPAWPAAGDFTVVDDGCVGRVLAIDDTCTVSLQFLRSTGGTSVAWVKVPDSSAPGAFVVAPVAGSAIAPPNAPVGVVPFPVAGGVGLSWGRAADGFGPTGFRVERAAGATWTDVSGPLDDQTHSWVDASLSPGQSATYRVRASNVGGESAASAEVTGTRLQVDPAVGPVSALTMDADFGAGPPVFGEADVVVLDNVQEGQRVTAQGSIDSRALQGTGITVELPAFIAGPGTYPIVSDANGLSDGFNLWGSAISTCQAPSGILTVEDVAYTPARALAVLSAHYSVTCRDGRAPLYGELRVHSTRPVSAVGLDPIRADAGNVPVAATSAPTRIEVVNRGTTDQVVGQPTFTGPAATDWSVASNDCPELLPAGARCAVEVAVHPSRSGPRDATLAVPDQTLRGVHHAALTANGTSAPAAPVALAAIGFPRGGVDLHWDAPADTGGTAITGYVVRRAVGTDVQTTSVATSWWTDVVSTPGVTYQVAAVTPIGQGPWSPAVAVSASTDSVFAPMAPGYNQAAPPSFLAVSGGSHPVAVPQAASLNPTVLAASTSPDGRQLLTTRNALTGATGWVLVREAVDGSGTPTVLLDSPAARPGKAAWSPDGTKVAVTTYTSAGNYPTLRVLDAATGATLSTMDRLINPAWHPDSRSLFVVDDSIQAQPLVRVDALTGARLGTYPGMERASALATSPDGRQLAAIRGDGDRILVSLLPLNGGPITEVPSSGGSRDLSWGPDGRKLLTWQNPWMGQLGFAISDVAESGQATAPKYLETDGFIVSGSATWVGRSVTIAPSAALLGPTSTFTIDRSALTAGAALACSVDGAAYVACASPYRPSTGSGSHLLRVRATEPGGRVSVASRAFTLDVTAPTTALAAPASVQTAATPTLTWTASDSGGSGLATYDVRTRIASRSAGFGAYQYPASWQKLTTRSLRVTLASGSQYCFSVRAHDRAGNVGAWGTERCTAMALDDRSLSASTGWTRGTSSAYLNGTYSRTTRTGAQLTLGSVRGRQIAVVATTCPTCGSIDVYHAGVKLGRVSLYSATTKTRQVRWLPLQSVTRYGTVTVRSTGTKQVIIDGLAITH